ncbi:MAG: PVC-type heme-binding CxxCH protein [Verrucomicrobiales bacterium]
MKFKYILAGISLMALSAYSQNPKGYGPEAAREQVKTLKTPANLEVSLHASEPLLRNPANMDVDAKGRVWVTEGVNYRLFQKWGKLRPEGDRIVILEDTDGDGVADKDKTFYQGNEINTALGICVLGDKVIVSCAPNVLLFKDENGDDVADGKPEILFTGISGVDHDHGVHAFVFGPDGKLYFNQGNDGRQIKRPDGKLVVDRFGYEVQGNGKPYRQGMVFRMNMDGSDFQVLGNNFRNNYEVCVDSLGTMWQSDNDDDGNKAVRINYVMDYGNFGFTDEMTGAGWGTKRTNMEAEIPLRHWHLNDPGVVPNLLQTGAGSPTGIMFYEGKLLPKEFQNQIIHCDAGPRVVRAYSVQPEGAGYKANIIDILTSDDTWFRPSDVCAAPDGSLYVADWNDAGVGGHYMADQKVETMTGRVYHVKPKGKDYEAPKLDLSNAEGAAEALKSPNQATRYLAWTALNKLGEKAEPALKKLWNGNDLMMKARAWHLLVRIPGKAETYLEQAIKDSNENIRNLALRYARVENKDTIPLVKKLVKDPSPAVRRECALSLYQNKSSDVPELWAELAQQHDGADRWYLEALGIGARGQEDQCFAAWLEKAEGKTDTAAARDIIWRSRSVKALPMMVKIISDKNTPEAERNRFFRALDFIKGPEKEAALLELIQ